MTTVRDDTASTAASTTGRDTSPAGLVIYALTLLVLVASGAAPSPLYPVYQEEWALPPVILTVVFAVYVAGLLLTLLTAGRLSDHIGRRPVILGGLVVSVAAMLVFAFAHDGLALVVARILQGLAIGLATGALGAGMIDHQPARRTGIAAFLNGVVPPAALTVGALGSGFLVAYGPAPEETVFVVLAALMVAAGIAIGFVPERQPRRAGALRSLIPSIAVPRAARSVFTAVVGGMIASWALGGMFLAFIGSVLGTTFGLHSAALTGIAIALFAGTGAITGVVIRARDARRSLIVGVIALVLGPVGLVTAIWIASLPLFGIAAVIGGVGFGAGFQAGLRLVLAEAPVDQRASLLSSVYVASYLAFGIPSVVAGVFVEADGLAVVLTVYGAFVAASALVALVLQLAGPRTRRAELIADAVDAAAASWPTPSGSAGRARRRRPARYDRARRATRIPALPASRPAPSARRTARSGPNGRQSAMAFIIVLLVLWAILTVVGFAIKGLVWLGIIGIILILGTVILGSLRKRHNSSKTPKV